MDPRPDSELCESRSSVRRKVGMQFELEFLFLEEVHDAG